LSTNGCSAACMSRCAPTGSSAAVTKPSGTPVAHT
jgi:hypothetical protein